MPFHSSFPLLKKLPGSPAPENKRKKIKVESHAELISLEKSHQRPKLAFSSELYFKART